MFGTAVHEFFEKYLQMWINKHDYTGYELEKQVVINWEGEGVTRKISGRYDIRENKDLFDLKNIKVWKLIFDPKFEEFHEQQNFYSYLIYEDQGIELDSINIVALYKDWQEGNALRDRNYPQQQMIQYELTKWDRLATAKLFDDRVRALVRTEDLADEDLPVCSREERWERHMGGETVHYAILKNPKAKRATKVIKGGDLDDAVQIAQGMKGMTADSLIEIRYAIPKRCIKYCDPCEYCNWYQNWCKLNDAGKVNEYIKFKV
jgi:hypothetical protein